LLLTGEGALARRREGRWTCTQVEGEKQTLKSRSDETKRHQASPAQTVLRKKKKRSLNKKKGVRLSPLPQEKEWKCGEKKGRNQTVSLCAGAGRRIDPTKWGSHGGRERR